MLVLAWLLPVLACNYPGLKRPSDGLPASDLRQTLQVQGSGTPATSTKAPDGSADPVPSDPSGATATPIPIPQIPILTPEATPGFYQYVVQSGDTLAGVALRFGVQPEQISAPDEIHSSGLLPMGYVLAIPWEPGEWLPVESVLPDSEVVYSPTTVGFDLYDYIQSSQGYLATYTEMVDGESVSGIEIIQQISTEASVNPRLLLAFLEFRSGWVLGQPQEPEKEQYPIGFYVPGRQGLNEELRMTATQLNLGYYGWRHGTLHAVKFSDDRTAPLHPALNPGSAALQHLFSKFYRRDDWQQALYGPDGIAARYRQMFGEPWQASSGVIFPDGLLQPALELPFLPGESWSLTAGPHQAWDSGSPRAAIDFSPVTDETKCAVSRVWVTAPAPGIVARSADNTVILDLDGDGAEQTGWALMFYHVADYERVSEGSQVEQDSRLGHPSCEGGRSTGKHVHFARKYNGEWVDADGPLPFVLSGWQVVADLRNYSGSLVKGEQVVSANSGGSRKSVLQR